MNDKVKLAMERLESGLESLLEQEDGSGIWHFNRISMDTASTILCSSTFNIRTQQWLLDFKGGSK